MRNGNFFRKINICKINCVLILPMRNGNIVNYYYFLMSILSSYPTYEEWKPVYTLFLSKTIQVLILPMRNGNLLFLQLWEQVLYAGSYPTYEEWKLIKYPDTGFVDPCSYPTYEEWKHQPYPIQHNQHKVLILPMRNGNPYSSIMYTISSKFLSYL